jgi:hypothetical protein
VTFIEVRENKWETKPYKLKESLEDVTVSVNCVPHCKLGVRLVSGEGSGGELDVSHGSLR